MADTAPPPGTVERWAFDYVRATELDEKLDPPAPPARWEARPSPRRLAAPGRPSELRAQRTKVRARRGGLRGEKARARLLATFHHHELQAAELMCAALLAFPETPREFREGLVRIALDEIRHMRMYREHLNALGYSLSDFEVRDWFWERLGDCPSAVHHVAAMGMGFEGGNLEHSREFARRFREVGDDEGARLQELVGREEIAHVRFAVKWFERWTGGQDFETWCRYLPPPLSPMLMRADVIDRELRARAGMSEEFLEDLAGWTPCPTSGS